MKKVQNILITLIFVGFIGLMGLLTFLLPARRFSENENRYLQEFPTKITVKKIMDGSFIEKFSDYASDHVPLRDTWVHMKAALERASGRRENAGVLLGKEDTLFMIQKDPPADLYERNLKAVNKLADNCSVPVYFGLIPTAASVWKDRVPGGAITADEDYYIDLMNQGSKASVLDVSGVLKEHAGEYIFYRTDHHWTSLGALYGTNLILEKLGLETIDPASLNWTRVSDSFYGTSWSRSGAFWIPPDEIYTCAPEEGIEFTSWITGSPKISTVYHPEMLEKKDQYSYFLGGEQGLAVMKTDHEGPRVLLIRDSYSDSLSPILAMRCSEVHMFDMRYNKMSVMDYIKENGIDCCIILYGFETYFTGSDIVLIGR